MSENEKEIKDQNPESSSEQETKSSEIGETSKNDININIDKTLDHLDDVEKLRQKISALEEKNKQTEHQSLMRELSRIKNKPVDTIKEEYKEYSNRDLTVLIRELDNNPDFAVFQQHKKEEKKPLVFYAGTMTGGKWPEGEQ